MLTCAKLSGHFTWCFEGQVQHVLYLCSKEPRTTWATARGMTGFLFHIWIRTLHAEDIFREQTSKMSEGLEARVLLAMPAPLADAMESERWIISKSKLCAWHDKHHWAYVSVKMKIDMVWEDLPVHISSITKIQPWGSYTLSRRCSTKTNNSARVSEPIFRNWHFWSDICQLRDSVLRLNFPDLPRVFVDFHKVIWRHVPDYLFYKTRCSLMCSELLIVFSSNMGSWSWPLFLSTNIWHVFWTFVGMLF